MFLRRPKGITLAQALYQPCQVLVIGTTYNIEYQEIKALRGVSQFSDSAFLDGR